MMEFVYTCKVIFCPYDIFHSNKLSSHACRELCVYHLTKLCACFSYNMFFVFHVLFYLNKKMCV